MWAHPWFAKVWGQRDRIPDRLPDRTPGLGLEGAAPLEGGAPGAEPGSRDGAGSAPERRASLLVVRRALVVLATLLCCYGAYWLTMAAAREPVVPGEWDIQAGHLVRLHQSPSGELQPHLNKVLVAFRDNQGRLWPVTAGLLRRSVRLTINDAERARLVEAQQAWRSTLDTGGVALQFADGSQVWAAARPRGLAGLSLIHFPLLALALTLALGGVVAVMSRPLPVNRLYLVIVLAQSVNLIFVALEAVPSLTPALSQWTQIFWLRVLTDIVTGCAAVHGFTLYPTPLRHRRWISAGVWGLAAAVLYTVWRGEIQHAWWWAQGTAVGLVIVGYLVLEGSYRQRPDPRVRSMRRIAGSTLLSLTLVVAAVWAAGGRDVLQSRLTEVGMAIWYVFFSALLLMVPLLTRGNHLMREFALLAGVSTIVTSLDLLFLSFMPVGETTALALSLFIGLGLYAGVRQWLVTRLTGRRLLTLERSFEALYRVARGIEAQPERRNLLFAGLLRELFDPSDLRELPEPPSQTRVIAGGAGLSVAMPALPLGPSGGLSAAGWLLRHAERGTRLFTQEDARLVERVIGQLDQAVAYDVAVERGRTEERRRLAQDLHDDIGARLLTLMYQAQSRDMEEYIRHTLQDLKTLTRGLAAPSHALSDAASEWKADLAHRLDVAGMTLRWSLVQDRDVALTVVQWSALTRIVRELVTNTIAHSKGRTVTVAINFRGGALDLAVADDGSGKAPQGWAHGLGLGGVRKRVKQLGGSVEWVEAVPTGIECRVHLPRLGPEVDGAADPAPQPAEL